MLSLDKNKKIQTRNDLENYAISLIVPLLESVYPIYDASKHIHGKAHWAGHFFTYLEGIARPLWILPFILNNTKKKIYVKYAGKKVLIQDWYKKALISGTNPKLKSYWGDSYKVYGQMSTEVAPIVMALAFAPKFFWEPLSKQEKQNAKKWFYKIGSVTPIKTHRNNHYWFPLLINVALKKLGLPYHQDIIDYNFEKMQPFYMGNGWYYDGTIGRYDYYMPWAHHLYPLLWMQLENKNDVNYIKYHDTYIERINEFLQYYPYFFDSTGLHLPFGRSLAYRTAAVGLLPMAVLSNCEIDTGLAKKITLNNISFFRQHGMPDNKRVEPGFTYPSYQNVERYISIASSYWFTKGFFALMMNSNHSFWKTKEKRLPIEKEKFIFDFNQPNVDFRVEGDNKLNGITFYNNSAYVKVALFGSTHEFYSKFVYNSRSGFGTSTRELTASDNMISLMTKDKTLTSHRTVFKDLGQKDGLFYSEQIPFSNDSKSKIKTAIVPLGSGMHIRIHKVELSRPYIVLEGGYSVGKNSDYKKAIIDKNYICFSSDGGSSLLYAYTPKNVDLTIRRIHPDAHLLYPLADYPAYITRNELKKGIYFFATFFFYSSENKISKNKITEILKTLPKVKVGEKIIVEINSKKYYIKL